MFARISVSMLEPDLVIMDEFQRFKFLLSSDDSELGILAHSFLIDTQNFAINRIPEKLAAKESKDIRFELSKMRNAMADIHSRVSDELYRKKQARSKEQER